MSQDFSRGSEWRKWDLHIHTPASFHWHRKRFRDMDEVEKKVSIDEMIATMNASDVAVFVIMDYWTFDGWIALKKRLSEPGAPVLTKKVFPGIELRLVSPTSYRLNVHAVFSDCVSEQELSDFKSNLNVALIDKPLSDECLIKLARTKIGADKLRESGFDKSIVDSNEKVGFDAGATSAEIIAESFKSALEKFSEGMVIPFIPWDTYNGLAEAKWAEHYAYVKGLMSINPIFETRNNVLIPTFNKVKTDQNHSFYESFQAALGNKPHLAVSGSDAHQYVGTPGDNNKRGYGEFPSNKCTWIKADTTFKGLLQAMKEPAKRSYIGVEPPKKKVYRENKTYFVDQLEMSKLQSSSIPEEWINGISLKINPDLVAIIGNKGSGKSALADIMALLGNTRQTKHFSFLKTKRFRGNRGEPARSFESTLTWAAGTPNSMTLSDDPKADGVEMIRYIPQGLFEDLCTNHASGDSSTFEKELRSVIFSHLPPTIRLNAHDFDELTDKIELQIRETLAELRKELKTCNDEISKVESRLAPENKASLVELKKQKQLQIEEHEKIKPTDVSKPSEEMSPEHQVSAEKLEKINKRIKEIDNLLLANNKKVEEEQNSASSIQAIIDKVLALKTPLERRISELESDLTPYEIEVARIFKYEIDTSPLKAIQNTAKEKVTVILSECEKLTEEKSKLTLQVQPLQSQLNAPQKAYQAYLTALEEWQKKKNELIGISSQPETLKGIEDRIAQFDKLPQKHKELCEKRDEYTKSVFDALLEQKQTRGDLFKPVQALIEENRLIREDYKLQFQSNLDISENKFATLLFDIIKKTSGKFRGEEESVESIKKLFSKYDLKNKDQVIVFCNELLDDIKKEYTPNGHYSIENALKRDHMPSELYNFIYGLEFIEPRYSIQFQDTQIEQLSPGQRGSLLLIFYLLVDKGFNPIILDQPEDNLDNETVVSLLVPVLTEAKKRRQIIMVTHNPNLAVVCDAEQVIYSSFDRSNKCKISYVSGSIENPVINKHIIDVLEGTRPAFDNRSEKYQ